MCRQRYFAWRCIQYGTPRVPREVMPRPDLSGQTCAANSCADVPKILSCSARALGDVCPSDRPEHISSCTCRQSAPPPSTALACEDASLRSLFSSIRHVPSDLGGGGWLDLFDGPVCARAKAVERRAKRLRREAREEGDGCWWQPCASTPSVRAVS